MNIQLLPLELLLQVIHCVKEPTHLMQVNKAFSQLALEWFKKANQAMMKNDPLLKRMIYREPPSVPLKIFMRLVNHLHDEAKGHNCEVKAPEGINRFVWECCNIYSLLDKLIIKKEAYLVSCCNKISTMYPDFCFDFKKREQETPYKFYIRILKTKDFKFLDRIYLLPHLPREIMYIRVEAWDRLKLKMTYAAHLSPADFIDPTLPRLNFSYPYSDSQH